MKTLQPILKRLFAFSLFVASGTTALGSSDIWYTPKFRSLSSSFVMRDVSGALVPSNDTRDNLIFLVADRRGKKLLSPTITEKSEPVATYATYGEGSICVSDARGRLDFVNAVKGDSSIPSEEKLSLQTAREQLACKAGEVAVGSLLSLMNVSSAAGKEFAAYLEATTSFYKLNHTDESAFVHLSRSDQPWVREASLYMTARVILLASQATAFDDWGTLDRSRVDTAKVTSAKEALNAYVAEYPRGAYAASATGLLRRAYWIGGDSVGQARAYSEAMLVSDMEVATMAMANEMDQKLGEDGYLNEATDPTIVAVQLFRLLRSKTDDQGKILPGMSVEDLETHRPRFIGHEDLFDYLRASRFWFVEKDAAEVLKLLPERGINADLTYLEFSRQIMRAQALAARDDGAARTTLVALFPFAKQRYQRATLEVELAKFDERHKNISAVFEKGTLIQDPDVRLRVLDYVAGPIILKQQVLSTEASKLERHTALYRLLVRDLVHGRFRGFLEDIKLLPSPADSTDAEYGDKFAIFRAVENTTGYNCPDLVIVAGKLAKNPKDVTGRLCLGDFFRGRNYELQLGTVGKDELGGTGTVFAGKILSRQDFYIDIMKTSGASRNDRAYALYRAIHCYAPIGANDCGGADVDRAQRKKWFQELKSKYADTVWAKQQNVYW